MSTTVKEYFFVTAQREKQALQQQGQTVYDFSIGNPDLPPPPEVLAGMQDSLFRSDVHGYQSNAGSLRFRNAAAGWYNRFFDVSLDAQTEVLPLQGSRQGILQISQALLKPGDKVLVPNPGYPSYSFGARMMGADVVAYSLTTENQYQIDFDELHQLDLTGVKIMWVNYPHMPTGAKTEAESLGELLAFARKRNIILVNDNAYALVRNNAPLSLLAMDGASGIALELNSLSKNYHMAGWRLGFVAGNPQMISQLLALKSHLDSGIALPLQEAGAAALDLGYKWFAPVNNEYNARALLAAELATLLGCKPDGGQLGMFLWAKMPGQETSSMDFTSRLLKEQGLLLAPGSLFGSRGEGFIRISLCAPLEQFEQAIGKIKNTNLSHSKKQTLCT